MTISDWGVFKTRSLFALILIPVGSDAALTRIVQPATHTLKPSSSISVANGVAISLITPSPRIEIRAIVGRDSLDTCGYVSGNPGKGALVAPLRRFNDSQRLTRAGVCSIPFDMRIRIHLCISSKQ